MGATVTYRKEGAVATVGLDDGKANVLSLDTLAELDAAFHRALADSAVVVLTGRAGVFSGGFDLAVLRAGGPPATALVRAGFELAERLLTFPLPVVAACPGHAVAMGLFLLLAADYRIGVAGPYKLAANEVAIGLTMPHAAIELLRQRLTPAALSRAVTLAETFPPDAAVAAGLLDRVVAPGDLAEVARQVAADLAGLDLAAHAATKRRLRAPAVQALRDAIAADHEAARTPVAAGAHR
jgi:enoyl-CoA hydratase